MDKRFLDKHIKVLSFVLSIYNKLNLKNKYGKSVKLDCVYLSRVKINDYGNNNRVTIGKYTRIKNSFINIYGNNNTVVISENCSIQNTAICLEDDNNHISIGKETTVEGPLSLATIEGTAIKIGENCMISGDIQIRTGDSHSILDDEGLRINKSKDIYIGDHVWICRRAMILKGAYVPSNSVIGAGSIVTHRYEEGNIILAGVPDRIVKKNTNWCRERL